MRSEVVGLPTLSGASGEHRGIVRGDLPEQPVFCGAILTFGE